jgi:hypothetical protein
MRALSSVPALHTLLLLVLSAALLPRSSTACYIQGYDSGYCANTEGAAAADIAVKIPFCAEYVTAYPSVCLPLEYPYFPNHTATAKDAWVNEQVYQTVTRRQAIEETNGDKFELRASRARAAPAAAAAAAAAATALLGAPFLLTRPPRSPAPPFPHTHTHTHTHTRTHTHTHTARAQSRTSRKGAPSPSASSKTRRAKRPLRATCAT